MLEWRPLPVDQRHQLAVPEAGGGGGRSTLTLSVLFTKQISACSLARLAVARPGRFHRRRLPPLRPLPASIIRPRGEFWPPHDNVRTSRPRPCRQGRALRLATTYVRAGPQWLSHPLLTRSPLARSLNAIDRSRGGPIHWLPVTLLQRERERDRECSARIEIRMY